MGLFKHKSTFEDWLKSANDDELPEKYEETRLAWLAEQKENNIDDNNKRSMMRQINDEMNRRNAEKHKNDPKPAYQWTDENRWDKD